MRFFLVGMAILYGGDCFAWSCSDFLAAIRKVTFRTVSRPARPDLQTPTPPTTRRESAIVVPSVAKPSTTVFIWDNEKKKTPLEEPEVEEPILDKVDQIEVFLNDVIYFNVFLTGFGPPKMIDQTTMARLEKAVSHPENLIFLQQNIDLIRLFQWAEKYEGLDNFPQTLVRIILNKPTPGRNSLQQRYSLELSKQVNAIISELNDSPQYEALAKSVKKTLMLLQNNPSHPGLKTHNITTLTGPSGQTIYSSYVNNNSNSGYRFLWMYGQGNELKILWLGDHKNYDVVKQNRRSLFPQRVQASD